MSGKISGLVWDLELPQNEKFVLLAYADHADHAGNNIFPSVKLIMQKTGYSERSIQGITRNLEKRGLLVPDGKGPKGTNKYKYGGAIPAPANFAGVQSDAEGVQPVAGGGATIVAPEPSLTVIKEPSIKIYSEKRKIQEPSYEPCTEDGLEIPGKKKKRSVSDVPEIAIYKRITGARSVEDALKETIIQTIRKIGLDEKKIRGYYLEWRIRGYRKDNLNWLLDWAVNGEIPPKNSSVSKALVEPKGVTVARSWLAKKQAEENNVNA